MGVLEAVFAYFSLLCLYYFVTFVNWLNSISWERFFSALGTIVAFIAVLVLVIATTSFLRKWINAQLIVLADINGIQKNVAGASVKAAEYGKFLAVLLLVYAIFISYVSYSTLQVMMAGNYPEELVGKAPTYWSFIPLMADIVLVVLSAVFLFQQKVVAIIFLSIALMLNVIGVGYRLALGYYDIGNVLLYLTIVKVLPLAYAIYLLRSGKLN
ncbi:MAG TPA: hypothetical protein VIZ65_07580 [Cellvibrionaceae bacterium]